MRFLTRVSRIKESKSLRCLMLMTSVLILFDFSCSPSSFSTFFLSVYIHLHLHRYPSSLPPHPIPPHLSSFKKNHKITHTQQPKNLKLTNDTFYTTCRVLSGANVRCRRERREREGGLAGPGVRDGMMGFGMGWKGDSMVGRWGWGNG